MKVAEPKDLIALALAEHNVGPMAAEPIARRILTLFQEHGWQLVSTPSWYRSEDDQMRAVVALTGRFNAKQIHMEQRIAQVIMHSAKSDVLKIVRREVQHHWLVQLGKLLGFEQ